MTTDSHSKGTGSNYERMRAIRDELFADKDLPLYEERIKNGVYPVIGEGSHDANLMFVGEAPGKNEAATGRPFCGASGKFLDEMLAHIGLDRKAVYITNVVKDRPPANRDPSPEEIAAYAPYLDRQIEIIKPKVIATLGRFSMAYLMKKFDLEFELMPVSKIHGKVFEGKTSYGSLSIVPLYHPAVALYNGSMREVLKKDFEVLKRFI